MFMCWRSAPLLLSFICNLRPVTSLLIIVWSYVLSLSHYPRCPWSFFFLLLVCFLEQGEVVPYFCFSNWSPQQLHVHWSDQFVVPLPAKKYRCLLFFCVWVVWIGRQHPTTTTTLTPHPHPAPLRRHTCITPPPRERGWERERGCSWA